MKWTQMDGKKMTYEDGSFDCIIDKACLDSILCGENSAPNSKLMLDEIYRVLSPNGVYICVSYGLPEMRNVYFNKYDWKSSLQKVAKPTVSVKKVIEELEKKEVENFHFIYILKKDGPEAPPVVPEEEEEA